MKLGKGVCGLSFGDPDRLQIRGLKLTTHRMVSFGLHLRIKMTIFESIGMFLFEPFWRKT